jgi:hypothetical protein
VVVHKFLLHFSVNKDSSHESCRYKTFDHVIVTLNKLNFQSTQFNNIPYVNVVVLGHVLTLTYNEAKNMFVSCFY